MVSRRLLVASMVLVVVAVGSRAFAQSPSVLYTFPGTGSVEGWFKNFGNNTVTLDNSTAGQLTVTEVGTGTAIGTGAAVSDDFNRVRESPTGASGGLDLTGLSYLEFDLGQNGTGNVPVQFFVQAATSSTFVALGPDVMVTPGVNTYRVPLTGLTADQQVYVRTIGINTRDHTALGNLTWTLGEVRSGGTPLAHRTLVTHDVGTAEGGLQGALVNFDGSGVQGNTGQNQSGLSQNTSGSGSLQWTDLGGGPGGAISWGNGTALNGNTFNNRTTDVSNYATVTFRMSATDPASGGGTLDVQAFLQRNGFQFISPGTLALPIDGQFHDLTFSLAGITDLNVVEQTGVNLSTHPQNLVINVDSISFDAVVPEPSTVLGLVVVVGGWGLARRRGHRAAC